MLTNETQSTDNSDSSVLNWSADAPRGGRAVLNRTLKENTTVPLFFAQTLIASLRDVGYNHTTSALCEHVDNAIEAGATEVRIYFRQSGKKGDYQIDAAVYDNGRGMSPNVLKVATSFGGSMSFNNRDGIGRFGMGMKTAALHISPVMELYSWQEPRAIYGMTLDVEAIGKDRSNLVELPDPTLQDELTDEIADLFTKPMGWPSDRNEQHLLATSTSELYERLGSHGTIVYMPTCDRLTFAKARTLAEHAISEMARIYRRQIFRGLRLYVNNRIVEAFDPTYSMADAWHTRHLNGVIKHSRLYLARTIDIRTSDKDTSATVPTTVKIFRLPIEEWFSLPRKTLKNDLRVFNGLTVSILRNDRELFADALPALTTRHSVTNWYRVQIDFPGALDEAFGVASNKQGVRMKDYVLEAIKAAIGNDITALNDEIKRFQAQKASEREAAKPATSELRASEVDHYHAKPIDEDKELTPAEKEQLEENLRGLAVTVKREGESDAEAYERVKASKYLIIFRHDEYWPFYHVEHKFGRVILTINTAHAFFSQLYDPVRALSTAPSNGDAEGLQDGPRDQHDEPVVALELLLLSLARAQSVLAARNEEAHKAFENLRKEWSETYRIQLTA